jgi:hypothetical protein
MVFMANKPMIVYEPGGLIKESFQLENGVNLEYSMSGLTTRHGPWAGAFLCPGKGAAGKKGDSC